MYLVCWPRRNGRLDDSLIPVDRIPDDSTRLYLAGRVMFVEIKQSALAEAEQKIISGSHSQKLNWPSSLSLSIFLFFRSPLILNSLRLFLPRHETTLASCPSLFNSGVERRAKERGRERERSTSHFARPSYPTVCVADGIMVHLGCTCCCSSILLNPPRRSSPRTYLHVSNN